MQTQHFKIESSVTFGDIFSNKEQNLEIVYYVNENVITHSKDWIGLFKLDFKGINDYVTYAWSDRILELENKCVIIYNFKALYILKKFYDNLLIAQN